MAIILGWISWLGNAIAPVSLARRFLIGALLWSLLMVSGTIVATTTAYNAQLTHLLDQELNSTLVTLSRAIDTDDNDVLTGIENKLPTDPRYEVPLSGRYWAIIDLKNEELVDDDFRSRSLWDANTPVTAELVRLARQSSGTVLHVNLEGPTGENVRVATQLIRLAERGTPVLLVAAADRTDTDAGGAQLRVLLTVAMLGLAVGTLLAMALGLRVALRPFERVQADINAVREGRQTSLSGNYPAEVRPLSEALNRLLEHNRSVVVRARTHVGNLAHALKTPLAVLRNEAGGASQLDHVVQRQTESMLANVEHYLQRAQAAARADVLGARTELAPVVDGLIRILQRLYNDRAIRFDVDVPDDLSVSAERQDLEEMLGNLMDNASKWARSVVIVSASKLADGTIAIDVDDDGTGLPETQMAQALKRGVRFDETAPGSGLGLSIVSDLAEMNQGELSLMSNINGGLRARLTLKGVG